jgi:hypothetical protein
MLERRRTQGKRRLVVHDDSQGLGYLDRRREGDDAAKTVPKEDDRLVSNLTFDQGL